MKSSTRLAAWWWTWKMRLPLLDAHCSSTATWKRFCHQHQQLGWACAQHVRARCSTSAARARVSGIVTITIELVTQPCIDAPLLLRVTCRPPFGACALCRKLYCCRLQFPFTLAICFAHLLRRKIYCSVFSHLRIFLAASNWLLCLKLAYLQRERNLNWLWAMWRLRSCSVGGCYVGIFYLLLFLWW